MFKRIWIAACLITLIMVVFIARLAWLQLMPASSSASVLTPQASRGGWQRLSVLQRQRNLVLDSGRGDFYDRFGIPVTGETYLSAALFPVSPKARGNDEGLK